MTPINFIDNVASDYANLLSAGIFFTSIIFAVFYAISFRIVTTVGKGVLGGIISVALVFSIIFTGNYITDANGPFVLNPGDTWWHPLQRAIIYTLVSYFFTRLVIIIVVRRFWPERLFHVKKVDEDTLQLVPRQIRRNK